MTVANRVTRLFSETVFELPLSPDYVRHWGMPEAVRELIQNALDSESPFEWELTPTHLRIISRFSRLDARTLLLGSTSKSEQADKIGSFGEGYKIALLVLTRNKYDIVVHNNDVIWRPEFRHSKKFDSDVLCIVQEPADVRCDGLVFNIGGLAEGDMERIRACCLQMQDNIGEIAETPKGRILLERPGELYVGGLFICKTDLQFGYDVKPNEIRLERDRQTVSGFDLRWMTKEMWFGTDRHDQIAKLIEAGCPDLEYANFGTPAIIKEACYRHFVTKNPGKVLANSQEQLDAFVKRGMQVVITTSGAYHSIVSSHSGYSTRYAVAERTPETMMVQWLSNNSKYMTRKAIDNFVFLIKHARSKKWRNG